MNINLVVPALIPKNEEYLKLNLDSISKFTDVVQVDIVDGKFVPDRSWPFGEDEQISTLESYTESLSVELDLMIKEPELSLNNWLKLDVDRVVIHLESTKDIESIIKACAAHNCKLGLSILNTTPLERLTVYMDSIDYVQLMGIREIGAQGQPFDESVLDRVTTLKTTYSDLEISIDGSVNYETLPRLRAAGASRFVAGSAILAAENPAEAYQALSHL